MGSKLRGLSNYAFTSLQREIFATKNEIKFIIIHFVAQGLRRCSSTWQSGFDSAQGIVDNFNYHLQICIIVIREDYPKGELSLYRWIPFILFGFCCFAYVELTSALLVWFNPNRQTGGQLYIDTSRYDSSLSCRDSNRFYWYDWLRELRESLANFYIGH